MNRKPVSSFRRMLSCSITVCALMGCGGSEFKEPPKVNVAGSVLLDGNPLADGTIVFDEGGKGIADQLSIQSGKFSGKVSPGEKVVRISAEKDGPPNEMYP